MFFILQRRNHNHHLTQGPDGLIQRVYLRYSFYFRVERSAPLNRGGTMEDQGRYDYIDARQTQQRPSTSNNSTPSSRKRKLLFQIEKQNNPIQNYIHSVNPYKGLSSLKSTSVPIVLTRRLKSLYKKISKN